MSEIEEMYCEKKKNVFTSLMGLNFGVTKVLVINYLNYHFCCVKSDCPTYFNITKAKIIKIVILLIVIMIN